MITSIETKDLFTALIKASAEIGNMKPEAKGYGYNYIELSAIIDKIKPVLNRNGLGVVQLPSSAESGFVGLTTRVLHLSGQWLEESYSMKMTTMKGVNESQASGATLSYMRRYALAALALVASDEDTDGLTADERNPVKKTIATTPATNLKSKVLDLAGELKQHLSQTQLEYFLELDAQKDRPYTASEQKRDLDNLMKIKAKVSKPKEEVKPLAKDYSPIDKNETIPFEEDPFSKESNDLPPGVQ